MSIELLLSFTLSSYVTWIGDKDVFLSLLIGVTPGTFPSDIWGSSVFLPVYEWRKHTLNHNQMAGGNQRV